MKKREILRSRELFKRIALEGKRIDGTCVRCSFLILTGQDEQLSVGFKVSARKLNAVGRNRVKRLMRAGIEAERETLDKALQEKDRCVGVLIFYKGKKEFSVKRLRLAAIQKDIHLFCRTIASVL
ncbi:MAG: ribonuclease P protein component [bacterium]